MKTPPAARTKIRRPTVPAVASEAAAGDTVSRVYAALAREHRDRTPDEIAATTTDGDATHARDALATLANEGRAVRLRPDLFLSDVAAARVRETARRALTTHHKQNPFKKAMPRDALVPLLAKAAALRDFAAVEAFLAAETIAVTEGHGLRAPDHAVVMPVLWQEPAKHILSVYEASGLTPPKPGDFQANYPRDVHVPTILDILAENNALIRLEGNLLVHAATYEAVKETLRRLAQTPNGITVATVRDATDSSRKIVLPLLEHFNAIGFTRRVADSHVLVD